MPNGVTCTSVVRYVRIYMYARRLLPDDQSPSFIMIYRAVAAAAAAAAAAFPFSRRKRARGVP